MNTHQIRQLIQWMSAAQLSELVLTYPSGSLRLTCIAGAKASVSEVPEPLAPPSPRTFITSPDAGVFQSTHTLRQHPEVSEGAFITTGTLVGYLHIGHHYHPVRAPQEGVISAPLCSDGQRVEYDTPLFELHTAS